MSPTGNSPQLERRKQKDRRKAVPSDKSFCHLFVRCVPEYAIVFFNTAGEIISLNPAAERLFGYRVEELAGQSGDFIFTPEDRAAGVPAKEMTQARDTGSAIDDRWHIRKDGSRFWANGDMSSLRSDDGMLQGFAKIVRDRTDVRKTLDTLQESKERLSQSNRELERFASIVSHDLQAPLYKIEQLSGELAQKEADRLEPPALQSLAGIRDTSQRMTSMIKGILNYARINKMEVEKTSVSISGILDNVRADLAKLIEEKKAEIRYGALPNVIGDEVLLYQLFVNILSNALKYSDKVPTVVTIACHDSAQEWHFSIKDNGAGIAERERQAIFGFMQRGAIGPRASGSGIGLAICKRIVERHAGRIWVESKVGEGSDFHFTLPKPGDGNA